MQKSFLKEADSVYVVVPGNSLNAIEYVQPCIREVDVLSMNIYVIHIVMNIVCIIYVIYLSVVKIWRKKRERGFTLRNVCSDTNTGTPGVGTCVC